MLQNLKYFDAEVVRKLLQDEINRNIEASYKPGDGAWGRYREASRIARRLGFEVVEVDVEQYSVQFREE